MATISNTPRPGYVWDSTDNVWYPIGVGAHQHVNAADTPAVMPYSTYAAAGKNKILNGDFRINQRSFTSNTTDLSYNFDRWVQQNSGGSFTTTPQTFTLGTAPVTGYEGTNFLQGVVASQSASTDNAIFTQKIESVRTLANQTATISFWAKAGSGTPKIAVEAQQYFGASGSPSSRVNTYFGQVTLSTSWTRYSVTATVPSISGKTLGTDSSDALLLNLWVSAGSTWDSRTGTLGIQNATFQIWGVQLEAGSTATAFQTATGNPASELAACQRYYWRNTPGSASTMYNNANSANSTTVCDSIVIFPVTMRTVPASLEYSALRITDGSNDYTTGTFAYISTGSSTQAGCIRYTHGSAALTQFRPMNLQSNSSSSYIGFSAEL